uniref:Fic family protein n=1 Tax=Schlesneria paludicola TaxID=360056 RepID=A0A7C4LL05_9PLAN
MPRITGTYRKQVVAEETVRAFVPYPLPPKDPPLEIAGKLLERHLAAAAAVERLNVAAATVPSTEWFLYGFVRKEAVISSQIEGTQATLEDIVRFEATHHAECPADVEEVCNYVAALEYARGELARPKGLPICSRLLCQVHKRLMRGVRGAEKQPGTIRTSQNWIGGTRPGNARFVPPPPGEVPEALAALDRWIHARDEFPPLVRAGLAHVQFETIHPFLDGNGRVGRLLVTLLLEHWGLLKVPLLYLSLAFKRHRAEYYRRLSDVRTEGDWEGWTEYFLDCVREAADDGVHAAARLFQVLAQDRKTVTHHAAATVPAIRLHDLLPQHPMLTLASAVELLKVSKPTAIKAIDALVQAGVLEEVTSKRRGRVYAYQRYLSVLAEDTAVANP